eukprot:SAG22_NODE_1353_length_4639_cov_4.851101_1_plen_62_part_00
MEGFLLNQEIDTLGEVAAEVSEEADLEALLGPSSTPGLVQRAWFEVQCIQVSRHCLPSCFS